MSKDLLLVGSIPLDTVEDVFGQFGRTLGGQLMSLPDGEVGLRRHWISRVHYQVLAIHPDIKILRHPRPDDGVERLFPHDASDSWQFRLRPGATLPRFDEPGWRLGFARDAISSYFVFKTLRQQGVLPPHLRFQVALPTVNSMLPPRIFPEPGDVAKLTPGLTEILQSEVATIVNNIPNDDLAIQFDCVTEIQDAYGGMPELPRDGAIERNLGQVRSILPAIPARVAVGFHFCFGTLGGWPRFRPNDLGPAVMLANAFVETADRQVDWLHVPVLDDADDAFLAPLTALNPRGARVYLGVVHHMDGFAARVAAARRFLPQFGIAGYCGFGRMPSSDMPRVLAEHLQAIATIA